MRQRKLERKGERTEKGYTHTKREGERGKERNKEGGKERKRERLVHIMTYYLF